MTKIRKKAFIILTAAVLLAGSMTAGLLISGRSSDIFGRDESEPPVTVAARVTETDNLIRIPKPARMKGSFFTAGSDYQISLTNQSEVKAVIDSALNDMSAMGLNTVFFDCDRESSDLYYNEGGGFDAVGYGVAQARKIGLYSVVCFDFGMIYSKANTKSVDTERIKRFCDDKKPDCLLLTNLPKPEDSAGNTPEERNNHLKSIVFSAVSAVRNSDNLIRTGFRFETENNKAHITASDFISSSIGDFVYTESKTTVADKGQTFEEMLAKWNESMRTSGGEFVYGLRYDLLFTDNIWNDPKEIIKQANIAIRLERCSGIAVRSYSALKYDRNCSAGNLLESLRKLDAGEPLLAFVITNHKSNEITVNESKISFIGKSDPDFPLYCDSKAVKCADSGEFSVEFDLNVGKNTFVFRHNGKDYPYNVIYEIELIKSVSPKSKTLAPGGSVIRISAVALKKANVYVAVGGKTIEMIRGSAIDSDKENGSLNTNSDFVTYYTDYKLPEGKITQQNLGKFTVNAKYSGLSKTMNGAEIIVTAKIPATTLPPVTIPTTTKPTTTKPTESETETQTQNQTQTDGSTLPETTTESNQGGGTTPVEQGAQLTPRSFNGVNARSKMCEVAVDKCETLPLSPIDNASSPLTTPFIKGMFDYIVGESSYDEYEYYILASGRRVYRDEVSVIPNGYNLPLNTVQVIDSKTDNDTKINLALLWKVPVSVSFPGQKYSKTYNDREYGVWSFTGTAVDFTFHHTGNASGAIDVSKSNTLSSAEWIKENNGTCKLRLKFRRTGVFYGYSIAFNRDGSLEITINNKSSNSLQGCAIMLDAGHGGTDSGALCCISSVGSRKYEKQINLLIAEKVKEKLQSEGATVLMTRSGDPTLSLDSRRNAIQSAKPDIFISIHCDASESSGDMGTSAYYHYPYSFPLADKIHKRIVSSYISGIYKGNPQLHSKVDRQTLFYPFRVARVEECPAILIEYGFVTNITECAALQKDSTINTLADATVLGITDYIKAF